MTTNEIDEHTHDGSLDFEIPRWFLNAAIGFCVGVSAYLLYDQWQHSRQLKKDRAVFADMMQHRATKWLQEQQPYNDAADQTLNGQRKVEADESPAL